MGKISELSIILDNLEECGRTLNQSARALLDVCNILAECGTSIQKTAASIKDICSSFTKEETVIKAKQEAEKTYSLEEVRAILSAKSKAGFREQVKEMIQKRGVDSLTKLDSSQYPDLVNEVEGLGNG